MKNKVISLVSVCALVFSLSACGSKTQAVKIKSDEEQIHLPVGEEISVTAQTQKDETIKWSSDNADIAVITADGRLTGVSNGITVVTAQTDSGYDNIAIVVGNGVEGTQTAIVPSGEGSAAKKTFNGKSNITDLQISLNGMTQDETLIMANDRSAKLKIDVTPASSSGDPLVYESSNPSVLEVDGDGIVYPKSKGTVTVTVTAPNGVSDTFKIFVR